MYTKPLLLAAALSPLSLILLACGGTSPTTENLIHRIEHHGKAGVGDGTVPLGEACETDADCPEDAICLTTDPAAGEALCSPSCTEDTGYQDCAMFAENPRNPEIQAPDDNNLWEMEYLDRFPVCAEFLTGNPETEGKLFCGYYCPVNSVLAWVGGDEGLACKCRPGFQLSPGGTTCERNRSVPCATGIPCTAETTKIHPCSEGNFQCYADSETLEGHCVDEVSEEVLEQCEGQQ